MIFINFIFIFKFLLHLTLIFFNTQSFVYKKFMDNHSTNHTLFWVKSTTKSSNKWCSTRGWNRSIFVHLPISWYLPFYSDLWVIKHSTVDLRTRLIFCRYQSMNNIVETKSTTLCKQRTCITKHLPTWFPIQSSIIATIS